MKFTPANSDDRRFKNAGLPCRKSKLDYSRNDQIIYSLLVTMAGFTLVTARWLQPSPNGFGTHEQLGLPSCIFLSLTGFPCPSCGLTTSFAYAARFHFYQAFVTQPFGLIVFCLTALSIPYLFILIHKRVAWVNTLYARGTDRMLYLLFATYLGSWLYKILMMT